MARPFFRKHALIAATAALLVTVPAGAQMFSDGYEFLKAVKDRNGDEVTDALNQPGTTVINARDITSGETALHIVTARRDVIWIQFLSQKGANPNIADKKGVTPLMLAVSLGFVEGVEALIDAGARTDVANDAGETPLIAAVHRRDVAMVRLLLSKGADAERNDNSGRSARDYATLMGRSSSMLEEIERADEERKNMPQAKSYGPSF